MTGLFLNSAVGNSVHLVYELNFSPDERLLTMKKGTAEVTGDGEILEEWEQ